MTTLRQLSRSCASRGGAFADAQGAQAFADDGAHLVLAGHTHGGQVCLPSLNPRGGPALVTNSDLPAAKAKGLHTLMGAGGNTTWVHVSAGIGTSAKAPIRFFCPPEASLLTLTPA